jgi:hypothetical protein
MEGTPHVSILRILNSSGDRVLTDDPELAAAATEAMEVVTIEYMEAQFIEARALKMGGEVVTRNKGGAIVECRDWIQRDDTFDPTAEEYILHSQQAGG